MSTLEDELRTAFARSLVRLAVSAAKANLTQKDLNDLQDAFEATPSVDLILRQEQQYYIFRSAFTEYRGASVQYKELHRRYTFCLIRSGKIRCSDRFFTHLNITGLSFF